jgi:tetratricopeptide (TPR) repeat protein
MALLLCAATGLARIPAVGAQVDDQTLLNRATGVWQLAYYYHGNGALDGAIELYRLSIQIRPTAEAHTFLGWALSHRQEYEAAIEACKKAIEVDPEFGNPYNDIGAYLIELGRQDEAESWLNKATRAERYCCYQFAWSNLGRVYLHQGRADAARRAFQRALDYDPENVIALEGLRVIEATRPQVF